MPARTPNTPARSHLRLPVLAAGSGVARRVSGWTGRLRKGDYLFAVVTAIVIGVVGAYGAILFRLLIRVTHHLFFATDVYSLEVLHAIPWWRRLLTPVVGGAFVGLIVTRFAPEVKGSGIPEVMESVARRSGAIRHRVLLTKAVAAALTIGSGGSAGREGPIVHIGSAIGSAVGQVLQVSATRLRTFVACGAAAAVAATFNAPISGALFSIEVVLGDLAVSSLSAIVISAVIATVISRHYLGDFPAFTVPPYEMTHGAELVLYAGLGILCGLTAVLFIRTLYFVSDRMDSSSIPPWLRPAAGGLGVGAIALGLPHVFGVGYATINAALWERAGVVFLLSLLVAKLLATSLTLGSGGSGGVFAPSLYLGAVLGAAWGEVMQVALPDWAVPSGAYALVGMGGLVAATTHAPITAILIIFELTNNYKVIPPLMLTCVVAMLISTTWCRESIYTAKLVRRGVRLHEGRDVNLLRTLHVSEVMDRDVPAVSHRAPFARFLPGLLSRRDSELIVVDDDHRLVGTISLTDVKAVIPESEDLGALVLAADVANTGVPFVVPQDNLDLVMHVFGRVPNEQLPVVDDAATLRVVGRVTRSAVIDAYNQKVFQADLAGGFHSLLDAVQGERRVPVAGDILLAEVDIPASLMGLTLREADLRNKFGVEVLLIHTPDMDGASIEGRPGKLPGPDVRLEPGDRLLVMGRGAAIDALREHGGT